MSPTHAAVNENAADNAAEKAFPRKLASAADHGTALNCSTWVRLLSRLIAVFAVLGGLSCDDVASC